MSRHTRLGTHLLGFALASTALAGCTSMAEGILDGVAGTVADVGSRSLYGVDEEACRVDPYWLAKKGVELEFAKERTFSLASKKCRDEFEVELNEGNFSYEYDLLLRDYCAADDGTDPDSNFCRNNLPRVGSSQAPERAVFTPDIEKMRNYEVGSLDCDDDMFKRKMNVARLARIEATSLCPENGECYSTANLVDRNRSESFGSSSSWANARGTPRTVTFTWDQPVADIEQIFIQTPEAFPLRTYSIEVVTPTGQQIQVAQVINDERQEICHRFNPLDVESITIEGVSRRSNSASIIYLNEVVVR